MNAGGRSEQTLAAAMAHHRAGRLIDAERLYRLVCDTDPKKARAFHLLGGVAHQLEGPEAALLVGLAGGRVCRCILFVETQKKISVFFFSHPPDYLRMLYPASKGQ